ncbi:MAG: universal stress protein [Desulfarculales bacterium]|jgi:nucleotide-binding universal stress UspA family protein|nr:universal stress protein [Desulfarculales bacterium]
MPYRKIAFATDFSQGAALAFKRAKAITQDSGSELILVHILPPLSQPLPMLNDLALGDVPVQIKERVRAGALAELENLYCRHCQELEPHRVKTMLLEGEPASALAGMAVAEKVDLLVIGSTGLSGLAKAMFGSVAAKVVQKAPCSVLVVRGGK